MNKTILCLAIVLTLGSCTIDYCLPTFLQTNSTCTLCELGHTLSNDKTACVNWPIQYCGMAESDHARCAECECGFGLQNTNAQDQVCLDNNVHTAGCATYTATGAVCNSCKAGYGLMADNTCKYNADGGIANCQTYESATVCSKCWQPYVKKNDGSECHLFSAFFQEHTQATYTDTTAYSCTHTTGDVDEVKIDNPSGNNFGCFHPITECATYSLKMKIADAANPTTAELAYIAADQSCCATATADHVVVNQPNYDSTTMNPCGSTVVATSTLTHFGSGIANCAVYKTGDNNPPLCDSCADGHVPSFNNEACYPSTVQNHILNCNTYGAADTTCNTCAGGYGASHGTTNKCIFNVGTIVAADSSVATLVKGCGQYTENYAACSACASPWSGTTACTCAEHEYLDGTCAQASTAISGCGTYQSPTICSACSDGHWLTPNNLHCPSTTASDMPADCAKAWNSVLCHECTAYTHGLALTTGKCVANTDGLANCMRYTGNAATATTCDTCHLPYVYDSGSSTCKIPNCDTEDNTTHTCTLCTGTNVIDSSTNLCIAGSITDCKTVNTATGECTACTGTKILNQTNDSCDDPAFDGCARNWKAADNSITCYVCSTTADVVTMSDATTGTCGAPTADQTSTCAHGGQYAADNSCNHCTYGYAMSAANTCVDATADDSQFRNCLTWDGTNGHCLSCVSGYGLYAPSAGGQRCTNAGITTNVIDMCTQYGTTSTIGDLAAGANCWTCAVPTSIHGAPQTADQPHASCAIANCATQGNTANGFKCQACSPGYCLSTDGGCYACQEIGNCIEASADNTCTKCKDGYFLRSNDGTNGGPDSTQSCIDQTNYYMTLGGSCYDGFTSASQCQFWLLENCATNKMTDNTNLVQCATCNTDYVLYTGDYTCNAAPTAAPWAENCINYNISTGGTTDADKCTLCADGYMLILGGTANAKCLQHCAATCSLNNKCNYCADTYYLSHDMVTSCTAQETATDHWTHGCKWAAAEADQCAECHDTFTLNTDTHKCVTRDVTNCIEKTDSLACSVCASGYVVSSGACVANNTACGFGCAQAASSGYSYDWPACGTCKSTLALMSNSNIPFCVAPQNVQYPNVSDPNCDISTNPGTGSQTGNGAGTAGQAMHGGGPTSDVPVNPTPSPTPTPGDGTGANNLHYSFIFTLLLCLLVLFK